MAIVAQVRHPRLSPPGRGGGGLHPEQAGVLVAAEGL
jgi:hypothetical protein